MTDVNIGKFVATTLKHRRKEIADNVTENNALLTRLKQRGNIEIVKGGRDITEPLIHTGNNTFQWYSGFQKLDISDGNTVDAATFDGVQAAAHFTMSGKEIRQNRGKEAIINLVDTKLQSAMAEMSNNINTGMYSDGTTTNQIGGLQLLVADDPTTSTQVGGINQSTYSWWQNQVYDFTDNSQTAAANMIEGVNKLYLETARGSDKTDLIVMESAYYTIFENSLQQNARYMSAGNAELGFGTLKYKGADVVWDDTASGMPANHAYFLNTKYLRLKMYDGAAMEPVIEEGLRPIDQDGLVYPVLFHGNLTTNNRARQGVLKT